FYQIDIRSDDMAQIMERERPEVINHHAAQMSVPRSIREPLLDADINIKGLINLLELAIRNKVKKFIFISSGGAIYGEASQYPTPEDYPPRPLSPYAITKLASEYYLNYYYHRYGLDYAILRYANVYGPRQIPHGEAGVVAIFMNNLLEGKKSILNHFPEDREGMIRDYCFVGDVVKSNLKVLKEGRGECFNIGTGQGTKTLELYRALFEAVKEIRPELSVELWNPVRENARPGDITRSCLIIEKARRILEWRPEVSLKEGVRLTLKWWEKQIE
ncbi:MAG: GDP-mannose 4,6-dehydratase, partial [Pseudomonadota bacterium]